MNRYEDEDSYIDDKLKESCGVIGVFLHGSDNTAARVAYYGLHSLQHRGQESTGLVTSDGEKHHAVKGMGLVSEVFNAKNIETLVGHIAVGHVLYSTSGKALIENAQPFVTRFKLGSIAVAHNGSLVNAEQLKEFLEETGSTFTSSSDSEVIIKLIAKSYKKGLERALTDTIQMIKGSYALTVMTEQTLIGARDPNGIRPLCLGKLENGWVLASESCAIDAMGGELVRDIEPGEIVIISSDGVLSFEFGERTSKRLCIFEYVYFSRPDSILDGIAVQEARLRMGAVLARESPAQADVVIGVPDSGLGSAMGYSNASGIPYAMGIVKNKYIGRTFIAPTQEERERLVFVKLNALKSDVNGKRVIIIDDSIVRGTTSRRLIQILRRAGAKEVHLRISSPPVKFPCYFGIDTPSRSDLISSSQDVADICKTIGADSLSFISLQGMKEAIGAQAPGIHGYCHGCFTGEYPIPSPTMEKSTS